MLDIFTHSALNDVEFIYVLNYLLALSLSIVMATPSFFLVHLKSSKLAL